MKVVLILAAVAVAAVFAYPSVEAPKHATKEFLTTQKNILKLLWRVQELNTYSEQMEIGKSYKFEEDIESYKNKEAVKEFVIQYKKGMLPRGDIFSVYYEPHRVEMIKLFEVFYYAKDFDTMFKAACWARDRVNEAMFVYSFSVAIFHRVDTRNFALPPFYEMFPQKFVDSEVLNKAYHEWFHGQDKTTETVFIPKSNYTEFWYKHDTEQRVAYFGEDVGINMHNKFIHLEYPFWMDTKKYGLTLDRKGELFYWMYQQMLSRYEMERLANYMPETEAINFEDPIVKHGYSPLISYINGVDFPLRPDNMKIQDLEDITLEEVKDFERRIRDTIDKGYFYNREGVKMSIKDPKSIDYIGKMVEGFADSPNSFYGKLTTSTFSLLSHIVDPLHTLGAAPGVLEHYETATRDPAFFSLHKNINKLFLKYKEHLTPYKREELVFSGVKLDNFEVDKLVTYFDDFEMDLYSMFTGPYLGLDKEVTIKTRMPRLNHKVFNYKFEVTSDKDINSIVRIFLGPKFNLYGHELTLDEKRQRMVEMDKFVYTLKTGKNTFTRSSNDAFLTMKDELTTKMLMNKIDEAIEGKSFFDIEESFDCGFPERMLLPRGRKGGMQFSLFVMVTPFEGETKPETFNLGYCDSYDNLYPDIKAMGFPFDRKVSEYDFNTPNMMFKDVIIFHKTIEEVNKVEA